MRLCPNPGGVITQTIWVTNVEYVKAYNLTLIPILPENWTYSENVTCESPMEIGDTCKFIYEITVPDDAGEGLYENLIKIGAVDGGGEFLFYKEIKTYFSVEKNEGAWWNTSWNYRTPIALNLSESLTDYQILVKLNSSNFNFSKANPDGSDIRFINGNNELPRWIESWNSTEAKMWVKVNLSGTKEVYMYYGNPKVYVKPDEPVVYENWESGTIGSKWSTGGNQPFIISGTAYEGSYSAGNGDIGDGQSSYIQTTVNLTQQKELSFYWKVSSEGGWDYLRFYVDGVQQNAISGYVEWNKQTYTLSGGVHTLMWYYTKDGSVSSGSDTGWIDKIELKNVTQNNVTDTGDTVFEFFDGAENGWNKWTSHDGWILSTGGYAHSGTYGFNSYPVGSQTERNMYLSFKDV